MRAKSYVLIIKYFMNRTGVFLEVIKIQEKNVVRKIIIPGGKRCWGWKRI